MLLYIGLTLWMFLILIVGLRHDSIAVANCWPDLPGSSVIRSNMRVTTVLAVMTFLLLWFLTAFRSSNIGNDTHVYLHYFKIYIRGIDRSRSFEIGYQYLNYLFGKLTNDPHYFLVFIATIMYGGAVWGIFRYSRNVLISLCLFFCYFFSLFTSMFRQGIAMVIVMWGFQLLKQGKKLPAALIFLLATTFHATAIISFLLFLNWDLLKKRWIVFSLTAACAILARTGALNALVNAVLPRYSHYFESQYASTGWLAVTYSLLSYLLWYILVTKSTEAASKADGVVAANFAYLLMFAAFGYSVNLFTRAGEYFLLNAVVEIPNMLYRGKVKNYRLWLLACCTFLLIMFIVTLIYRPGWNHLYPYEFWR